MRRIKDWLLQIGMLRYHRNFLDHGIDFEELIKLTSDDLKEIGVKRLADRKMLLREIEFLSAKDLRSSPQRRLLSVFFCDLIGSTALSTQLDPEELRRLLKQYRDTVVTAVTRFGGHVAQFMGDGVLAYFGWPHADEDQAAQAVRAGLKAIAEVKEITFESGTCAQCRIGIATGRVVVGGQAGFDSAFGKTPNLAARLQSIAEEDQIVIDSTTRYAIGKTFDTVCLHSPNLKGFDGPVEIWAVTAERECVDRFESRSALVSDFIGRIEEMASIEQIWRQAQSGQGQTVIIYGEAGIGKSRLVKEFCDTIPADSAEILQYQCLPHHSNSAFYPIIRRLEEAAQIDPRRDTSSEKMQKIIQVFEPSIAEDSGAMAIIGRMLSIPVDEIGATVDLSPQAQRKKTIEILIENAMQKTRVQPLVLVIEDAHWIDASSKHLLDSFLSHTPNAPILILVASRYTDKLKFDSEAMVQEIVIKRLSNGELAALAKSVDQCRQLSSNDVENIALLADGIPLYAEEIAYSAIEHGFHGDDFKLPETIEASLTARLDSLSEAKGTIQIASAFGREFKLSQIEALIDEPWEFLDSALRAALASGLLQEEALPNDRMFRFKHALIQDVAYSGMLRQQRQQLHKRIATDVLDESIKSRQPEVVAHHLTCAGLLDEAVTYWKKAGARASAASANAEAIAHYTKGLELIRTLPANEVRMALEFSLQVGLAAPLIADKGYTSAELQRCISEAMLLSKKVKYTPEIYSLLYSQWSFLLTSGSMADSLRVAMEFSDLAESKEDNVAQYARYRMLGASHMCLGQLELAREELSKLIDSYRPDQHQKLASVYGVDLRVAGHCFLSEVLWLMGFVDQARENAAAAYRAAKKLRHLNSYAISLHFCGVVNFLYRDADAVRRYMQEMMALAEKQAIGAWPTLGSAMLGWSNLTEDNFDEAYEALCNGIRAAKNLGVAMFIPIFTCRIAEILMARGRLEETEQYLQDVEALIGRTGEEAYKGEVLRLFGEYKWREGHDDDAERQFEKAIMLSRSQKARSVELRAATSYAKFLTGKGDVQGALAVLNPVTEWFVEGETFSDLQTARAMIAELQVSARV